ncbi:MAG: glycosyltransferase [Clostridiales bacterium]|nr:glycosyltransferase [Clostridiales bacterium]
MQFDNMKHSLSVVMGVRYLREDLSLLERAVRSISNQTYSDFEFLICENGSTNSSRKLLEALVEEDPRIRLIDGTGADTLAKKLNRCIEASHGEWIARQDDDDYSEPERFEKQLDFLKSNPEISFVGCNVKLIQEGEVQGIRKFPQRPVVKDFLFTQPYIHPALIFRKKVLDAVGGYCEEHRCDGCEDYDLLLRLYENGYLGANLTNTYFTYTLPPKGHSNRTFRMRVNEMQTRFVRFRSLGLLPRALPYVIKPVLVGLIPSPFLPALRSLRYSFHSRKKMSCEEE